MFIFGLSADEVVEMKKAGYNSKRYYENNHELKKVLDMIRDGSFSKNEKNLFEPIYNSLVNDGDNYMLLADFDEYVKTQEKVAEKFKNQEEWTKEAIINAARMGFFSSDRTIKEYADDIWNVKPVEVKV